MVAIVIMSRVNPIVMLRLTMLTMHVFQQRICMLVANLVLSMWRVATTVVGVALLMGIVGIVVIVLMTFTKVVLTIKGLFIVHRDSSG